MNKKHFVLGMTVTILSLLIIWGGWSMARMLLRTSLGGDALSALDKVGGKQVNFLCMGLDEDKIRADTIMLVSVEPKAGTIKLLSIPRDTQVQVNGKTIKINSTMSYERREELMIEKVREITGLPVHYYAEVDFDGLKKVVDVLGGVDYEVPDDLRYDDPVQNLHINLKKGMQHLDGQKAHDLLRFRHSNDGVPNPKSYATGGDDGRIRTQQAFLKALAEQKLKPQYITKVPQLLDEIYKYVKTNLSVADALSYAGMLNKLNAESFQTYTLPGEDKYTGGLWYFIYDPQKTKTLIDDVFLGNGATASPTASAQ